MKRLIFILSLIVAMGIGAQAQTTQTTTFTADTLTNTDTGTFTSSQILGNWAYAFQVSADTLSGSPTVTGILQYSNDNSTWTTVSDADSLSVTVSGSIWWELAAFKGKYIRAYLSQTGTGTSKINAVLVLKRPVVVNQ